MGRSQAITLQVADMSAVQSDLKAKDAKPDVQPWGTYAIIRDSEENSLILVELPK